MHMRHAGFPGQPDPTRLVLRKDIAHTLCPGKLSTQWILAQCASNTDRPQQRQAIMASGRDRVQVLAGHFASSSTEGQTLDIQAQFTRATAPMLAGQVRNHSASADCERSAQTVRACRSRSLLVQARVWELQQPSSSLSMAPKWWSQTSIVTSLNRYCTTQLYIRSLQLPQWNTRHCLQVASEIREAGGQAMSVPGDVTAEGFASKIIKATIDKYGALHILVNNAGQQSLVLMQTDPCTMLHVCRRGFLGPKTALSALHCYSQTTTVFFLPLSTNDCAEVERICHKLYSFVTQNLLPLSHRVHMGRSHTQNAFQSMGCNACCTSDSTLQAHTSCHPLHERRSKGRDAEAWQSSAKEHHQCVFYKRHSWECWSSQLCYGECHYTAMMVQLQCVDGPVFGMAVVALDSPACMLC